MKAFTFLIILFEKKDIIIIYFHFSKCEKLILFLRSHPPIKLIFEK